MLGSNQRPLPCESGTCWFAIVRRDPISAFLSLITQCFRRGRSLSSAPVVVKLSSDHRLPKLLFRPTLMHPSTWKGGSPYYADQYSRTAL
jgi:hypothetical protein